MKYFTWQLQKLLNTPAPYFFILGTLLLAILSSAVYELTKQVIGENPLLLTVVAVLAFLALVLLLLGLQRLVMRFRPPSPVISPDQEARPHAGLILSVGLSDPGPEEAIIRWHMRDDRLQHCWLLLTPEVRRSSKFQQLRQQLPDTLTLHIMLIENMNQAKEIYETTRQAIQEARDTRGALPLVVDITGGSKAMTVGMTLACHAENASLQYLPSPRSGMGDPVPSREPLRPILIPIKPAEE